MRASLAATLFGPVACASLRTSSLGCAGTRAAAKLYGCAAYNAPARVILEFREGDPCVSSLRSFQHFHSHTWAYGMTRVRYALAANGGQIKPTYPWHWPAS